MKLKDILRNYAVPFVVIDSALSYLSSKDIMLQSSFREELLEPSNLISAGILTIIGNVALEYINQYRSSRRR